MDKSICKRWLQTASLLDPPFDYFSFVDLEDNVDRIAVDRSYFATMVGFTTKHPDHQQANKALVMFQQRGNMQLSFSKICHEYWEQREFVKFQNDIYTKRLETFRKLNEGTCKGIEVISKND